MVILTNGGEAFRDAIANTLSTGQYGSDGTTESESDTSLLSPIASSQKSVGVIKSGLTIQTIHNLSATESNGETLREFALQSATQDLTRTTTTELVKDNTKRVVTTNTLFVSIN